MASDGTPELSCNAQFELRDATRFASGESTDEEATSDTNLIWLGILLGLSGSVAIASGQALQKRAFDANWPGVDTFWFWTTTLLIIAGVTANFVAFPFAPASVLAPLEASQFVTLYFIGVYFGDESYFKSGEGICGSGIKPGPFVATLIVSTGVVLPVVAVPSVVYQYDVEVLWCFWRSSTWLVWMTSTLALGNVIGVLYFVSFRGGISLKRLDGNGRLPQMKVVLYAFWAASLGGFGVANAKIISELVEIAFNGDWGVLKEWLFWMSLLFILLGMLLGWFFLLFQGTNRVFAAYPSSELVVIPALQGAYIFFGSIGGGIYFQEFSTFNSTQAALYAGGMTTLFFGLWLLLVTGTSESSDARPKSVNTLTQSKNVSRYEYIVCFGAFGMPLVLATLRPTAARNAYRPFACHPALLRVTYSGSCLAH